MGHDIVECAIRNLQRAERLIKLLDEHSYSNLDTGPYYSSIGGHLRHVLDIFACIIRGMDAGTVDLTDRRRGTSAETDLEEGLKYLRSVVQDLSRLEEFDPSSPITIVDNLGSGKTEIPSTLGAGLCQAHSHAIHHFACVGYLLHLQGIELPDRRFGYNPTTPRPLVRGARACGGVQSGISIDPGLDNNLEGGRGKRTLTNEDAP